MRWILGSRSPQRKRLLEQFDPRGEIVVLPPRDDEEEGFDGLSHPAEFEMRILRIARAKFADVCSQIPPDEDGIVVCADTTVLGQPSPGVWQSYGKPPEEPDPFPILRRWLLDDLGRAPHCVLTAVILRRPAGEVIERLCKTLVTFRSDNASRINWYLSLGESRGKAGGYAIQGAGSILVDRIEGSLSNVIGLPLEILQEVLV